MKQIQIIQIQKEIIEDYKQEISRYKTQHETDSHAISDLLERNHDLENKLVELRIQLKDKKSRDKILK